MNLRYPVRPSESAEQLFPRLTNRQLQLAVPYAIVVSVIYLFGYWGTFQINPLEYVGVSDLIKLAAYPLMTVLVLGMFGALFAEAYIALMRWTRHGMPTIYRRIVGIVMMLISLGSLIVLPLFYRHWPSSSAIHTVRLWSAVVGGMVSLSGLTSYALSSARYSTSISPSRLVRTMVILTIVAPLFCGYPFGRLLGSRHLKDGCAALEVDLKRSDLLGQRIGQATYLGYLGNHTFMREWATGAIVIERIPEGRPLVLLPSKTRTDGPPRACNYSGPNAADGGRPVTSSMIP